MEQELSPVVPQKKRGTKPKNAEDRRTEAIVCVFTKKESRMLKKIAKEQGMARSVWIRKVILAAAVGRKAEIGLVVLRRTGELSVYGFEVK